MQSNRRNFLVGSSMIAAASLAGCGYNEKLKIATTMNKGGIPTKDPIYGDSLDREGKIVGTFTKDEDFSIRGSVCNGCTSNCGVRVKIDNRDQTVVKVTGSPYNPLSTDPWLPYETPLQKSFEILGKDSKDNLKYRSTACARGNIVFDKINDPLRVLKPLKRVGKRGENKWEEIDIEQLLEEIVAGGNLFGEGDVEGLASIRNLKDPVNPSNPEMGPKANGLCVLGTGDDGRKAYMVHRFVKSFGTKNYMGHTSICGLSMRAGEAAYLNDFKKYPHLKPDFEHCEYLLTFGTAPAQAGNPFKRQAKLLAEARTERNLKCVVVSPMLSNADSVTVGEKSEWIPIKPGGDLAFTMGLLRVIIEENLYNKSYLSLPSKEAQKAAKDASFSNATHLVIQDKVNNGKFLLQGKEALVVDSTDGVLKLASQVKQAELFIDKVFKIGKTDVHVKSSMTLLKEAALNDTLDTYAKESGISKEKIIATAREFVSHGRKSSIDCHGGTMHTTGFYTTYAIMMLGAMVGNLNYQGGMSVGGGRYKDFKGKNYNLVGYKGKVNVKGYRVDKTRTAYEKTMEFKEKKARGENPYPAKDTWYPFVNAIESDVLTNSSQSYPYKLKALLSWNANFVYGQSGTQHLDKILKDPKDAVGLFIAIDPFINETSKYADYIIPDSVIYETWGVIAPWAGYQTKVNTVRFPTIEPKQAKFKNNEPICMDSFVIELGKRLKLPGFGKNAIKGNDGKNHSFDRPRDFYIRAFENIALDGKAVPDIDDKEITLAGLEPYVTTLEEICGENWRKTAYVMARGGRFESKEDGYKNGKLTHPYKGMISIYNQILGTRRHAMTAEKFSGVPKYYPSRLNDGKALRDVYTTKEYPLDAFSYKSNVLNQSCASSPGLLDIRYSTYIDINPQTASKMNVKDKEMIHVISADGKIKGIVRFRNGIYPGSIGIEHGLGRDGEGAVDVTINGKVTKGLIARKSGVNINKLGLLDRSRTLATLSDFVIGSNARQAIPARIEKI